ncbi:MAG TPA: hypothetical protein DDW36_00550 [Candidatus Magasanikbacteria bacterium]|nr:hypothetical protein [Candidatus Magasanikbacteria bacterium]
MKQKYIWILIVVIIGLLVLLKISSGSADKEQLAVAPTFVANKVESSLVNSASDTNELGDIPIGGGFVDTEFRFKNAGSEPVAIVYGETSCMCTKAVVKRSNGEMSPRIVMPGHGGVNERMNMTIEPGEEAMLVATFDPLAHGPSALGPIRREIVLQTNSKNTPELRFLFNGNVIK